jgi:hypothetical protein
MPPSDDAVAAFEPLRDDGFFSKHTSYIASSVSLMLLGRFALCSMGWIAVENFEKQKQLSGQTLFCQFC